MRVLRQVSLLSPPRRRTLLILARTHRNAFDAIQIEVPSKSVDEIKEYSSVFWDRYTEIDGTLTRSLALLSTATDPRARRQTTSDRSRRSRTPKLVAKRTSASGP